MKGSIYLEDYTELFDGSCNVHSIYGKFFNFLERDVTVTRTNSKTYFIVQSILFFLVQNSEFLVDIEQTIQEKLLESYGNICVHMSEVTYLSLIHI